MKRLLLLAPLLFVACSTFYEEGKKVAVVGSDVEWMEMKTAKGTVIKTGKIGNSAIYGAVGGAVSKTIMTTATGLSMPGAVKLFK